MNHIYFGVVLSLFCVFVAYFLISTLLLVTVICSILACSLLKDDFPLFRYVATHVVWLYYRICEICCNIENMYNLSDSSSASSRKRSENNGILSSNLDRKILNYNPNDVHNLSPSKPYLFQTSPLRKNSWNTRNSVNPRQVHLRDKQQISAEQRDYISPNKSTYQDETIRSSRQFPKDVSGHFSPLCRINAIPHSSHGNEPISSNISRMSNKSALDASVYANVNSPGFCGRVAEHLTNTMTHQPKYDTVGAFPVVHLKSNPSKIKIKTPVRVRLAPRSNDLSYSSVDMNSMTRSPLVGADESMKSVLQVLKEISRKRIHSHIEEDSEDTSKRLRVSDVQYSNDSVLHTSLLQQTIQGKRAREETSPNEDDVKKRRKPLVNNEITSSLSSSLLIKPPHLKSTKRKAPDIDDSVSPSSTLGKQLKIQTEVTPPLPRIQSSGKAVSSEALAAATSQQNEVHQTSLSETPKSVPLVKVKSPMVTEKPKIASPVVTIPSEKEDDQAVSRLLGRMSTPTLVDETYHPEVHEKKNVFMSTNDLSLSPPKENRLAAMIAVLGGPSDNLEGDSSQPSVVQQSERNPTVKALFTSPLTPDTPKQHKKVTFCNTLTETKIYDRDTCVSPLDSGTTTANKEQNTNNVKPLSLNFGFSAFSPPASESVKQSLEGTTSTPSQVTSAPAPVTQALSQQSTATVNSIASTPKFALSASSSQPENVKPPTFNFGAVPSGQTSQASPPQLSTNNASNSKPFSFGTDSKTPVESTGFGSPSIFPSKTVENGTTKSVTTPLTTKTDEQSKQSFNLFTNKNALTNSGKNEELKNNQLVNGFPPTSATKSSHPIFNISVPQDSSSNSIFQSFPTNSNSSVQSPPAFSFGLPSSTTMSTSTTVPQAVMSSNTSTSQTIPNPFTSSANQSLQSTTIFNNATNNLLQSNPFNKGVSIPQSSTSSPGQIGNLFTKTAGSAQPSESFQGSSVFGNSSFGTNVKDSKATQNITPIQTSSLFGGLNTASPKLNVSSGTSAQSSNQKIGGFSFPTTTSQVTPFGVPTTTISSQAPSMFGNTSTTTQSSILFGTVTSTSTAPQVSSLFSTTAANATQPSMFSASGVNQTPKSVFTSSTPASPFGIQTKDPVAGFGNQNTGIANAGNQNSITPTMFGNQTTPNFGAQQNTNAFSFGSPNISNAPQNGFNATGTMAQGANNSTTEVKPPPAFNSSSSFMFGSSNSETNKEPAKPFGTAMSFSFGSNAQQPNQPQPSLPTFGSPSTGFSSGQQIPVFGAGVPQPAAPAFNFGQQGSPAPTFQFNAATPQLQPAQGGMFSIGSGGSSAVRSKAGAYRRRHKPA